MKKKYLREVDIVTSIPKTECKQFLEESRSVLYLLSELVNKKVECAFKKIGIKIWPKNKVPKNLGGSHILDNNSSVLVLEIGYDLDDYNKLAKLADRHIELIRIIKTTVSMIDSSINFDIKTFVNALEGLEEKDFIFRKEYGAWKHNRSKTKSIKLFANYDHSGIDLGVVVKSSGKKYEKVFANYHAFEVSALYELGNVDFCDNEDVIYVPKGFYGSIRFNLTEEDPMESMGPE
jgi:hypothetical protein